MQRWRMRILVLGIKVKVKNHPLLLLMLLRVLRVGEGHDKRVERCNGMQFELEVAHARFGESDRDRSHADVRLDQWQRRRSFANIPLEHHPVLAG